MKRVVAAAALAALFAMPIASQAQSSGFATGWNLVKPINCVFVPGNPAVPGSPGGPPGTPPITPASPDTFFLDVSIIAAPPTPGQPPPPPDQGTFSTTDPVAITIATPFCKDGSQFYVYWDGSRAVYFSLWPH